MDDAFSHQVRAFLSNLYNHTILRTLPLLAILTPLESQDSVQSVRSVRGLVLKAIEQLNPGPGVSFRSPQARAHAILNLHYVEGLSVQEVAVEMAMSERTLYRELRKAEEDLALSLWDMRRQGAAAAPAAEPPVALVLQEAERIGSGVQEVEGRALAENALAAVQTLSQRRQVGLEMLPMEGDATVRTERLVARQALINVLSHAIQESQAHTAVSVRLCPVGATLQIEVRYQLREEERAAPSFPEAAQQLVRRLGGRWSAQESAEGQITYAFTLSSRGECTVLVIDDNASLLELFQRYLADEGYDLVGALDGQQGLRLAEEMHPDVVVLDVMMPRYDGWEVLQWFHTRPTTRDIPVVVCSVLDDPELAFSLGAAQFLAKPVDRARLLTTLAGYRQGTRFLSIPEEPAHND